MTTSMCESAGGVAGLSVAECDDDDLCRYHQGVADTAVKQCELLASLGVQVFVADALQVPATLHVAKTGEIHQGSLEGLVSTMSRLLRDGVSFRVEPVS